jgi:beta-fructofuranosidase
MPESLIGILRRTCLLYSSALFLLVISNGNTNAGITYKPAIPMWDTWIYQEGDDYHLFFLSSGNIGRAVSKDLIHWETLPSIQNMAEEGDWDRQGMVKTGCTIKHGDTYYLSYGSGEGSPVGFLTSKDLLHWEPYPGNPVLPSKAPYKEGDHWRDLSSYLDPEKNLWEGYLFGIHEASDQPSIAYVTSRDYLNWEYHEPVFISEPWSRENNGFIFLEVPEYFRIGGKHYLIFSSVRSRKENTSGRKDASGTWYLVSDNKQGPYRVPESPLLLGYGHGRIDTYVGRTIVYQGQRLLYHHTWADWGLVSLGTPKIIQQDPEGNLELRYWPGLAGLEEKTVLEKDTLKIESKKDNPAHLRPHWQLPDMPRTWSPVNGVRIRDAMITCSVRMDKSVSGGLMWHIKGKKARGICFYPSEDLVSIGEIEYRGPDLYANTIENRILDEYQHKGLLEGEFEVRVMLRRHMAEIYIDDRWVFTTGIKDDPGEGGFGFWTEGGELLITGLKITELEPLN